MSTTETPPAEPAAAPEPEKEKKKTEPRPYVVLRQMKTAGAPGSPSEATAPQVWEFVRNVEATSAEQAIRKTAEILVAASEDASFSGSLVAVPARNFKPEPVSIETKTSIKIG